MLNVINPYKDGDDPKQRDQVGVDEVLAAKSVTLNPVFEYREMIREIPVMDPKTGRMLVDPQTNAPALQPMRTPLVMPVGFTIEMHPVHVPGLCYGTTFRFLSQMDKRDADTQRKFAKECREMMKEMRLKMSDLIAPTTEDVRRIGR